MQTLTDDVLYANFISGDTASYDELMIRYGDSLTAFLNGFLDNWHDAEDLMIEAFARIMVKKPKIGEGCFKAYLYKTARNLAARFHGVKKRAEVFSFEGMEDEIIGCASPEDDTQKKEREKVLNLCMSRIDPELREALWLFYVEGLSYAEVAEVMKVNRKRVDRLLQKGKEHLRNELGKEGVNDAY